MKHYQTLRYNEAKGQNNQVTQLSFLGQFSALLEEN